MSLEQARGEDVDARTDLFSFGAVLYEMAAGVQAFTGATSALVFDSILNRSTTPLLHLKPALPAELDRIVSKALEKDPDLRYQVASEIRADLKRLRRELESGRNLSSSTSVIPLPNRTATGTFHLHGKLGIAAALGLSLFAAVAIFVWLRTGKSGISSVAVLPFANDMGSDSEYLADGIIEDVIIHGCDLARTARKLRSCGPGRQRAYDPGVRGIAGIRSRRCLYLCPAAGV